MSTTNGKIVITQILNEANMSKEMTWPDEVSRGYDKDWDDYWNEGPWDDWNEANE